ncbi:atherin-like [Dasypus novemcinctus]|uniref:atherin-like n=1 Tax=Dasypus novemcinctus TaxID=9361 RepID=UPI0039C93F1A
MSLPSPARPRGTRGPRGCRLKFLSPPPPHCPRRVPIPLRRPRSPTGAAPAPPPPPFGAAEPVAAPQPPSLLTVVTRSTLTPPPPSCPAPRPHPGPPPDVTKGGGAEGAGEGAGGPARSPSSCPAPTAGRGGVKLRLRISGLRSFWSTPLCLLLQGNATRNQTNRKYLGEHRLGKRVKKIAKTSKLPKMDKQKSLSVLDHLKSETTWRGKVGPDRFLHWMEGDGCISALPMMIG